MTSDIRREKAKILPDREDVQTGIERTLLEMLYDRKITIPEFKKYCVKNDLDYNYIAHCCGCAGCYEPEEGSLCPDFEYEGCEIRDPKFCCICGKKARFGYPLRDKNDNEVYVYWICAKHGNDKKLKKELTKGTAIESIIQKWNR